MRHGEVLLRVATDESGAPGLWDSRLFTTVSTDVSATWSVGLSADGSVTFGPEAWRRAGFWEAYFDREPAAVRDYDDALEKLRSR